MSIVPLVKMTACGHISDKQAILSDFQEMGCLHIIPLSSGPGNEEGSDALSRLSAALKFLVDCPNRRRQVRTSARFDAEKLESTCLHLQERNLKLADERDFLCRRIRDLEPWGDFALFDLNDLKGERLWFYRVPHYHMKKVRATELRWHVAGRDNRFSYVVVIRKTEPEGMPVTRTHTGKRSLTELQNRLEAVEVEIEDIQAERWSLTRWCELFTSRAHRLADAIALSQAANQTLTHAPLFGVQGWMPRDAEERILAYCKRSRIAMVITEPEADDPIPTLLQNSDLTAGGQDLLTFYTTPAYRDWDPSPTVFVSFVVFFAMILSDAGYAAILGLILCIVWGRLGRNDLGKRLRTLFAAQLVAAFGWGVLIGSYFGIPAPSASLFGSAQVLDLNNSSQMIKLSITLGALHIVVANIAQAVRNGISCRALAPIGWILLIIGSLVLWLDTQSGNHSVSEALRAPLTLATIGSGALLILLFSESSGSPAHRLLSGMQAMYKITTAFGDVLSYLRLFALGLASASLALAFNGLASRMFSEFPAFGILFALIILGIGHSLNLLLCIMSGFVHGLRLIFIEFFRWGLTDEGFPFRPFAKKEKIVWN